MKRKRVLLDSVLVALGSVALLVTNQTPAHADSAGMEMVALLSVVGFFAILLVVVLGIFGVLWLRDGVRQNRAAAPEEVMQQDEAAQDGDVRDAR